MPDPTLLTIILNYRTPELALAAAAGARAATEDIPGGLIIVDNDSGDGSFERIAAAVAQRGWDAGGRVRVLQTGRNGGFGAGNNAGIRAGLPDGAAPDYVYVLNPDAVPAPDAVRRLLAHLEAHPGTGFAGSYIHGPDGEPHATAFRFPGILGEFQSAARTGLISRWLARHRVVLPIPEATRPVDWLAGASLMMRRRVLDEIGLFDEGFFLYFDETDLCRRARDAGWRTDYVRDSEVSHEGSVSTGMKTRARRPGYWFDSRLRYFVKHHGPVYAAGATLARLAGGAIWQVRRLLQGRRLRNRAGAGSERFLRDLLAHDLRAALRALSRRPGRAGDTPATAPAPARPQRSRR